MKVLDQTLSIHKNIFKQLFGDLGSLVAMLLMQGT